MAAALAAATVAARDAGVLARKVHFSEPPHVPDYAGGRSTSGSATGRQDGFGERDDGRFDELRDVERSPVRQWPCRARRSSAPGS